MCVTLEVEKLPYKPKTNSYYYYFLYSEIENRGLSGLNIKSVKFDRQYCSCSLRHVHCLHSFHSAICNKIEANW